MENILIQISIILIQLFINYYFIISVTEFSENKKYPKKTKITLVAIYSITMILAFIARLYFKPISSVIMIVSTFLILQFLLKIKFHKTLLILFIDFFAFRNY